MGTFIKILAINANGTISMGATLQVFGLLDVELHSIVLESVVPRLFLILECQAGLVCERYIVHLQESLRVWGLHNNNNNFSLSNLY